jgi:hypothetical protein
MEYLSWPRAQQHHTYSTCAKGATENRSSQPVIVEWLTLFTRELGRTKNRVAMSAHGTKRTNSIAALMSVSDSQTDIGQLISARG